ncbi:myc box-dependent-interacting protein 1-like [Ruditapes philippinarum]|uniref:myc box-dependent-interacting protein 1-like n=1 Tax=Ruditapes philippinarum TaxID=129788 RepID=UPI00295B3DC4|nr:myc box-dependent-interacting protein 1-like [Ruditapes philippinarum]
MAEHNKGGILNKAEVFLRRRKTKLLQTIGKQEKTTDDILLENSQKLEKQQEVASKFQKELKQYVHCAKALSLASKSFYSTVAEVYEPEWENHAQITEILTNMDMLWQDYLTKLQDQVQEPLTKYLATIPQIKARVSKRGRKMIDYDNAKHGLEVLQNAKKKDDAKIAKAQEDLGVALQMLYCINNVNVCIYFSRVVFYGNLFQSLFTAESVFQTEAGKVWGLAPDCHFAMGSQTISDSGAKLASDHEHHTYTPRKNIRSTVVPGRDRGDAYRDSLQIPFFFRYSMSRDDSITNGHVENGPDSPQPDSPTPSSSPNSPTSPEPVSSTEPLTNGTPDTDTSKESIEQDDYVNTQFKEQERKLSESDTSKDTEVKVEEVKDIEVKDVPTDKPAESEQEGKPASEEKKQEEDKEEDVKVNGDLDTSTEQEVPTEAPPPIPASLPPTEDDSKDKEDSSQQKEEKDKDEEEKDKEGKDSDSDSDSGLYQVPPPAKPVADDLPKNYLYTEKTTNPEEEQLPPNYLFSVIATHCYKGEDEDEISFDASEIIYVVDYEDPEEQDPGWLMGVRKCNGQTGVFPENFTKKV